MIVLKLIFMGVLAGPLGAQTLPSPHQVTPPAQTTTSTVLDFTTANDLMMKNNPVLKRELGTVGVAQGELIDARQLPNPSLDVGSESYPVFDPHPGPFFDKQELSFRLGQTLETAGKRAKRTAVAQNGLNSAKHSVDDVVRQLKLELKNRYYSVALAQTQFESAKELLRQFDELLKFTEARYKQGEVSGMEAARLRIERLKFFADVGVAELQLKNSRTSLVELLGVPDLNQDFMVSTPLPVALPTLTVQELQSRALRNRPDLWAQSSRVARETSDIRLQRALAIPNVTPEFGYKRDFGANTLAFGLNIPLPLFNRNQGGVVRAGAEAQRQESELIRLELQVRGEVQQSSDRLASQNALVQQLEQTYLPAANKVRDTARQSFRLGAIDLVALIDAERTYRETIRSYNQALFDRRSALSALEAAIGEDF